MIKMILKSPKSEYYNNRAYYLARTGYRVWLCKAVIDSIFKIKKSADAVRVEISSRRFKRSVKVIRTSIYNIDINHNSHPVITATGKYLKRRFPKIFYVRITAT